MSQGLNLRPYIRSEIEQDRHNKVISIVARNLMKTAYQVMADHIDWDLGTPPEVNGYTPDIFASKLTDSMLIEVETLDSYYTNYALNQLRSLLATSTELKMSPFLIIPNTIGAQIITVQNFLKKHGFKEITLGGCDIRSGKLKIF